MAKIYAAKSPEITQREIDNMQLSRRAADECMVLLENDGVLPLAKGSRIALFGSGARHTIRGGTGSGDVNTRSDVNIEQGLENGGFIIVSKAWLDIQDRVHEKALKDYREWIPAYAKEHSVSDFFVMFSHPFQVVAPAPITEDLIAEADADTAVYVISRTSGEGADRSNKRGDYLLYQEELDQLKQLAESYEKLVVVLNIGGVMDLSEIRSIKGVNAVLLMGQLGNLGGDALADVLSGDAVPSGKLVDSWAMKYSDYPGSDTFSHNDGDTNEEYYSEGIYVGYRYFDTFGVQPLYPFGYGLSYTKFEVMPGICSVEGSRIKIDAAVTNTGNYPGKEVIQLYCSAPEGTLAKPYQELKAFRKTALLAPGESEIV
ncbi:MAG: glycoside hydrolase family 3 C-terminal domain-containing protein, partial [Firmicutes bacterium]|nr:glycoside hydrolase family 3 C-terminal domain-containing protein [Bacillota bacterium]